jgi:hypothetical protein
MDRPIRWIRILLAAVLLELAITAVVIPFALIYGDPLSASSGHPANTTPYLVAAAVGCAVLGFAFGRWTARAAGSRFALHGLLTGIVATLLYVLVGPLAVGGLAVIVNAYGLPWYLLLNALRISGCWLGGIYAGK